MKYAYFPGCSLESTAKEYGESVKAICEPLGIELVEIPGWNCCGSVDAVYSFKPLFSMALAARNLALAEKTQMDVVTPCSACYFTLSKVNQVLKEDATVKSKVDEALKSGQLEYHGGVKVRHFADVVLSDIGLQKIKDSVKTSLAGFKVASYYGCFLVRPPNICSFDNPEHQSRLESLAEALGASKVDYQAKTKCCGAALGITDEKTALAMSREVLINAKNAGANCLVTACPMCHFNLDARQPDIESRLNVRIGLPILHFTQLIGLALGLSPNRLGLNKNCVPFGKLLP